MDLHGARVLARAGLLRAGRPDRTLGMALALGRWGLSVGAGFAAAASRDPHGTALIDDEGALTFRELDRRTDRMAAELRARGVLAGSAVGLLARNGRGFVEPLVALTKLGADVLLLNTGAAGSQLGEVLDREQAMAVLYDADFGPSLGEAAGGRVTLTTQELAQLAGRSTRSAPRRPERVSRLVILTSGTTGAPRGAARSEASVDDLVSFLDRIPLRARETTFIASPLFHAWGLAHLTLAVLLGSTVVLQRTFDAARVLQALDEHEVTGLVVVPVMLDLMLREHPRAPRSLRVIASSGSAFPGDLATRVLETFGPVLYNMYGSTEVAYAAIATPDELAADPHTAGKPPHGVRLRLVDDAGEEVPPGTPGRIFAGSGLAFGGYTDGSDKARLDGLVATGDVGVIDSDGLLRVLGRDDDMVVIGGENVYPKQVEDCLARHPAVREVAVTSVEDEVFGWRLVAHVVGEVASEELQTLVRSELARFAVPREFRFLARLPRNATGKVLKRELAGS